jgi:NAD(P)-dependent dehydrogenase (short-subunit alcohol dehydrogenase family)
MTGGLRGSVAVVTGAAGGVGQAVSRHLADIGLQVFDLDRRRPEPAVGHYVAVDVADPDSINRAVAEVLSSASRIDCLVAAAGVSEEPTPAEQMDSAVWQRTLAVNLTGAFLTCQRVGQVMLEQRSGRIVTIASMSGAHVVNVPQQQVAYNASKGGLVAMTKSLAYEWAHRGVRVEPYPNRRHRLCVWHDSGSHPVAHRALRHLPP